MFLSLSSSILSLMMSRLSLKSVTNGKKEVGKGIQGNSKGQRSLYVGVMASAKRNYEKLGKEAEEYGP